MRALGLRLIRDTRPNQFYPTTGEKLELTSDLFHAIARQQILISVVQIHL
jgi:hypothetical protein